MSSCERCWADSQHHGAMNYHDLLASRTCTPEQQAGPGGEVCKACGLKSKHQHTGECMNRNCDESKGFLR